MNNVLSRYIAENINSVELAKRNDEESRNQAEDGLATNLIIFRCVLGQRVGVVVFEMQLHSYAHCHLDHLLDRLVRLALRSAEQELLLANICIRGTPILALQR